MRKTLVILAGTALLVAAAGLLAVPSPAQNPPKRMAMQGPGGAGFGGELAGFPFRMLDLTDAQKDQIKSLTAEQRAALKPYADDLKKNREDLRAATAKGQFNEAEVRALITSGEHSRTEMEVERLRLFSKIYALLTPEQQQKVDEFQSRQGRRPGNRGPGG